MASMEAMANKRKALRQTWVPIFTVDDVDGPAIFVAPILDG